MKTGAFSISQRSYRYYTLRSSTTLHYVRGLRFVIIAENRHHPSPHPLAPPPLRSRRRCNLQIALYLRAGRAITRAGVRRVFGLARDSCYRMMPRCSEYWLAMGRSVSWRVVVCRCGRLRECVVGSLERARVSIRSRQGTLARCSRPRLPSVFVRLRACSIRLRII